MSHIALTPDVLLPSGLKRYALLFDKIVVAGMGAAWDRGTHIAGLDDVNRAEYRYLHTHGYLDDLDAFAGRERVAPLWTLRGLGQHMAPTLAVIPSAEMRVCRRIATELRATSTDNIVPFTVCDLRAAARVFEDGQSGSPRL